MSLFSFLGISRQADARGLGQDRWVQREQILASLLVVAWVVEARDPYTGGHLWRVSCWRRLKFDPPVRALPTQI